MKDLKILRHRAWNILRDSVPNFILYLSFYISATINLHYLSYAEDTDLYAGCGLGTAMIILCIYSLLCSLNIAVINIGSHALGNGLTDLVGYTLHRAIIIDLIMVMPIAYLLSSAAPLLSFFGTDPKVAAFTVSYATKLIPAMLCSVIFNALHYFLANHKIFYPQIAISGTNLVLHYFWCQFFSWYLEDTFLGVIYAKTLTEVMILGLTIIFICRSPEVKASWFYPDKKSFEQIPSQLKHGVEAGALIFFEEISYEIITMLGGGLPATQIAAQVAMVNFSSLNFVIAAGIGLTANTYMAEKMGRGSKSGAISYFKAAILVTAFFALADMMLVSIFRNFFMSVYSRDSDILLEMGPVYTFYTFLIPFDFGVQLLGGALRAVGREDLGAKIFFVFYYLVAIPLSYYFGVSRKIGTIGMWIGIGTAIVGVCLGCIYAMSKVDWNKQIQMVRKRVDEMNGDTTQHELPLVEMKEIKSFSSLNSALLHSVN